MYFIDIIQGKAWRLEALDIDIQKAQESKFPKKRIYHKFQKHKSTNQSTTKRFFSARELNEISLTQKDTMDGRT